MAKFRQVYISFWNDPKVMEEMTPEDKYFFVYALTNPKTTQIGIYQISKKIMAFEMGYSKESVDSLIDRFERQHKTIKYNKSTRELAIKNWGKYNLIKGGKPVEDCIRKELEKVKDKSLIPYVAKNITNVSLKEIFQEFITDDTLDDTSGDTPPSSGRQDDNNNKNNNNNKDKKKDNKNKKNKKNSVEDSDESSSEDEPDEDIRYTEDSMYYQAALYLRGKILEFNPKCKVPDDNPKQMDKWANDMRLIFECDERTKEEVAAVIKFIFNVDDFWRAVVQSPSGLRKNWDTIYGQMISKKNRKQNNGIGFQDQVERMEDW